MSHADIRIGIDLGTTNSLAAITDAEGRTEILENREMQVLTPSAVGLPEGHGEARLLVGDEAINAAQRDPKTVVRSIKRFMGLAHDDPRTAAACGGVAYELHRGPSGGVTVKLGDRHLTPEEVSAEILMRVRMDAEERLGRPVTEAVITVPAYFLEHQRAATRRAGALAGLKVLALLDEPTAAALSESTHATEDRARSLIFDMGGGTLDISLIMRNGQQFTVLSYAGDNFLGGDDVDRAIVGIVRDWIVAQGGRFDPADHGLQYRVRKQAEATKRSLASGGRPASVVIPGACRKDDGKLLDVDFVVTQEQFAEALAPIENRVRTVLRGFLERESVRPEHLSEIIMVGGSSALVRIRNLLQEMFENDGKRRVVLARKPMEAVARGAAIYARSLAGLVCDRCKAVNPMEALACSQCDNSLQFAATAQSAGGPVVNSRLPRSLGAAFRQGDDGDAYQVILKKGSTYPIQNTEEFRVPHGDSFIVRVYEGDDPRATANEPVTVVNVLGVPSDVGKGDPVRVTFSYTRDRTLFIELEFPTSRAKHRPRWRIDPPDGGGRSKDRNDPLVILTGIIPTARNFLGEYTAFIDAGPLAELSRNIEDAENAILREDRDEARRLVEVLHALILEGCGIASTLMLADRTRAHEHPQLGPAIQEGAAELRRRHEDRSPDIERQRVALHNLIGRALAASAGHTTGDEHQFSREDIYR